MFDLEKPSNNFARVRDGRESMPLWMDIDLSTARSIAGTGVNAALSLNISGNSFFVDADTGNVGNAIIHFQDTSLGIASAPFYAAPGFVASVPFTQILIENAAQAGKRLRIFYGVDLDFRAGVNASVISGSVSISNQTPAQKIPVYQAGQTYGASFKAYSILAAATAEQVFSPASNVNGAIIHRANGQAWNAGAPLLALVAKNSAPASVSDGDVIATTNNFSTVTGGATALMKIETPINISAGKGLYFINIGADTTTMLRSVLYTLL